MNSGILIGYPFTAMNSRAGGGTIFAVPAENALTGQGQQRRKNVYKR
jgi:hypothetical protein